jgi:HK97 family phage portal protein
MKQKTMTKITGGVLGAKAVSLGEFDDFLDWLVDRGNGSGAQDLYAAVAWNFWCVNLRADSVSQIPWNIYDEDSTEDIEENERDWPFKMRKIHWAVEAWLQLKGAAYVLQKTKRGMLTGLQVLNSNTMKVLEWDSEGPTKFRQQVGSRIKDYDADEIVYFRTWSPIDDIGEGVSSGEVAQQPGALIKALNEYGTSYFKNGAIPAVLLTTEGAVPKNEKQRIESAWNKMLQGVRKMFKTVVLERGLTPTVVGQTVEDLAMPDLERAKKEQILAAHKIPPGLAEAKTNRAERQALLFELWTNTIIPEVEVYIQTTWDEQLFNPRGLRIGYHFNEIEVLQRTEIEKAESASFMVGDVMLPAYQAGTVSVDEVRGVINTILQWMSLPELEENFQPPEPMLAGPMLPAPPNPLQLAAGNESDQKKVTAPLWGHLRASLRK